jgi:hypothetical protein
MEQPLPRVCIGTGIKYDVPAKQNSVTEIRMRHARKLIEAATEHGFDVMISDASQDTGFGKEIESSTVTVMQPSVSPGMASCRADVFENIYGKGYEYAVWVEPEKDGVIPQLGDIVRHAQNEQLGIVCASRSSIAMATHPRYMAESEIRGNAFINNVTLQGIDYFMGGPHVIRRDYIPYFVGTHRKPDSYWYNPQTPWEGIMNYVIDAQWLGTAKVGTYLLKNYAYPKDQRIAEENDPKIASKRADQYQVITEAVTKAWIQYREHNTGQNIETAHIF